METEPGEPHLAANAEDIAAKPVGEPFAQLQQLRITVSTDLAIPTLNYLEAFL
jgi:hypothetical protein